MNRTPLINLSSALLLGLHNLAIADTSAQTKQAFERCFSALTGSSLDPRDPVFLQVADGSMGLKDACMRILDSAGVNSASGVLDSNNKIGIQVMNNMHRLHASWLRNKIPTQNGGAADTAFRQVYDPTISATFFTRALLQEGFDASSIFAGKLPTPVRSAGAAMESGGPAFPLYRPMRPSDLVYNGLGFSDRGEMIGFRDFPSRAVDYDFVSPAADNQSVVVSKGSRQVGETLASGFTNSFVYVYGQVALGIPQNYADGATKIPRKWGESVLSDGLCLSLPALRLSDVETYVDPTSQVPFRTTATCTVCHASIDQTSALIRNVSRYSLPIGRQFYAETRSGMVTLEDQSQSQGNFARYTTVPGLIVNWNLYNLALGVYRIEYYNVADAGNGGISNFEVDNPRVAVSRNHREVAAGWNSLGVFDFKVKRPFIRQSKMAGALTDRIYAVGMRATPVDINGNSIGQSMTYWTGTDNLKVPINHYASLTPNPPLAPEIGWPAQADPDFFKRPPSGRIMYRDYAGRLVDEYLGSISQLSAHLAQSNQAYVCLAKRYYQFFVGVDVDVADPSGKSLSMDQAAHRSVVVSLGENLKKHQSIRKMISEIFDSRSFLSKGKEP